MTEDDLHEILRQFVDDVGEVDSFVQHHEPFSFGAGSEAAEAAWERIIGAMNATRAGSASPRLRQLLCQTLDHDWTELREIDKPDPTHVVCKRCGRSCEVIPADCPTCGEARDSMSNRAWLCSNPIHAPAKRCSRCNARLNATESGVCADCEMGT